ncbi:MAG TPA: DUF4390 domain-containing protein [Candidatus Competibacteraceae bacterium]|nr:DUF4390 domain-containing protein [Candidatus Competibacteraceae bacterium]
MREVHVCRLLPLLLLLVLAAGMVWARGFLVQRVSTHLEQGVYRLDADIEYGLSEANLEAMRNGVPITVELEMEVRRRRDWLWDVTEASLRQRYRLEYHALSGQYLVSNLNSGERKGFPTLGTATDYLGRIRDFPLLDSSLLEPGGQYYGRLRVSLDIEALPAPLRPVAYFSADWRLASDWYRWPL